MKALVQKVLQASVTVEGKIVSQINSGLLVFLGVEKNDGEKQMQYIAKKVANLRIFADENNKMNLSVQDVSGEILVVSQFTLAANLNSGNRPGFDMAATPEIAEKIYEQFIAELKKYNLMVKTGIFQTDMKVALINDGPCTFILGK